MAGGYQLAILVVVGSAAIQPPMLDEGVPWPGDIFAQALVVSKGSKKMSSGGLSG
jgi:hypothetical protein